jgi:hypothetical protein
MLSMNKKQTDKPVNHSVPVAKQPPLFELDPVFLCSDCGRYSSDIKRASGGVYIHANTLDCLIEKVSTEINRTEGLLASWRLKAMLHEQ